MKIRLINIEWNSWNGFILEFLNIEAGIKEGTLIGINLDKSFCCVDFLFFNFTIWQRVES